MTKQKEDDFVLSKKVNEFLDDKGILIVSPFLWVSDVKEFVKKLKEVLISRICTPNKPLNTFQNAREHKEIIKEEFDKLAGDLSK